MKILKRREDRSTHPKLYFYERENVYFFVAASWGEPLRTFFRAQLSYSNPYFILLANEWNVCEQKEKPTKPILIKRVTVVISSAKTLFAG